MLACVDIERAANEPQPQLASDQVSSKLSGAAASALPFSRHTAMQQLLVILFFVGLIWLFWCAVRGRQLHGDRPATFAKPNRIAPVSATAQHMITRVDENAGQQPGVYVAGFFSPEVSRRIRAMALRSGREESNGHDRLTCIDHYPIDYRDLCGCLALRATPAGCEGKLAGALEPACANKPCLVLTLDRQCTAKMLGLLWIVNAMCRRYSRRGLLDRVNE
jgi:hypothetical protein